MCCLGIKAGYLPEAFKFVGQVGGLSGAVALGEASSGSNKVTGRATGTQMTLKGWTGEVSCEYSLTRASYPPLPSTAAAVTQSGFPPSTTGATTGTLVRPVPTPMPASPPATDTHALERATHGTFPTMACKGWYGTLGGISGMNSSTAMMQAR